SIWVFPSKDGKVVGSVSVESAGLNPLPISSAMVIAHYGAPCRLFLAYFDGVPSQWLLLYPSLPIFTEGETIRQTEDVDFRLQLGSPIERYSITNEMDYGNSDAAISESSGPWLGFISADLYKRRFLGMAATLQP